MTTKKPDTRDVDDEEKQGEDNENERGNDRGIVRGRLLRAWPSS